MLCVPFMQERAKAQEEHKRNIMEYREFLKSCDFIKVDLQHLGICFYDGFLKLVHLKYQLSIVYNCFQANSQWRKVQDRLEDDERCSRLEKIDRLEVFQVMHFILLSFFFARWVRHEWHTTCDTIYLPRDRSQDSCVR